MAVGNRWGCRMLWFLVALVVAGAVLLVLARLGSPVARARFLRQAGLVLTAVFTFVGAMFIAGEMLADPGGWRGAGLVAMWAVPLAVLLAVSWYRVAWATVLLGVLTAGVIGLSVWSAVDPESWWAFENANGPLRAIASFVLAAPIALFGWRKPLPAGVLLVALGVAPLALSAAARPVSGAGSLLAVSVPPVLTGILYLVAVTITRRASETTAAANHQ